MRYTPGQFAVSASPIGMGSALSSNAQAIKLSPTAYSSAANFPNTRPVTAGTPNKPIPIPLPTPGATTPIEQKNPYGGNNGHGYYHGSNRWSGRQVSDRPNPITRIGGEAVPLPPHATAGSLPRRPIIPAIGYGGTSQNNPNPGVSSMSVGATSGGAGSGSGKLATPTTGLRGI